MTDTAGPTRRRLVRLLAAGGLAATAGCSVSVGTTDLTIRNCLADTHRVSVTITRLADDTRLYDETHDVPGDSCSDVSPPPVEEGDVIGEAGEYRIRADADGMDSVTETREFSEPIVENNDDSINVYVEDDGLNLN